MPGPDGCLIASGSRTKVHKIASYNQILESENMTLQLPDVVQAYFAVTNGGDAAHLVGSFPGSPVQLSHVFTLEGGRIRSLEITPC